MTPIRAVIFDFDGLLADTETLHFETFAAVLAEEGIHLGPEAQIHRFMGVSDAHCYEMAYADAGRELPPRERDGLVARKAVLYQAGLRSVRLFPGARELAREAAARGPATIASCGRREDIEALLERHGLSQLFPRFVSAEDVDHSKPHPQCFLKALDLLRASGAPDLTAAECLVFEDSVRGVEAARRAGMLCAAVTNSYPAEKLAAADWVLATLEDWRWP
jgi:HAD superfamily hydrolase (TIGR01509 family)